MSTSLPASLPTKLRQGILAGYNGNTGPMSKILGDIGEDIEALAARVGVTNSSVSTSLDYQIRKVETAYTPTISTPVGTLTAPATVTGYYSRPTNGKKGELSIRVVATGTWSMTGAAYVELSLPSGWTGAANNECFDGGGFGAFAALTGFGQHQFMWGVVHPGATKLRVISPIGSSTSPQFFAVNGVATPCAMVSGDYFDIVGTCRLA